MPPSVDFHELTPPQVISLAFVGEAPMAISYQPCPPGELPLLLQSKILGLLLIKLYVEPAFVERYKPPKPFPVLLTSTYK